MAQFRYQAVDQAGTRTQGHVEAIDRRSAIAALRQQGRFVSSIVAATAAAAPEETVQPEEPVAVEQPSLSRSVFSRSVNAKDILAIVGQLSTALRAGLPLLQGLEIIQQQQAKPAGQALLAELAGDVSTGSSLSQAMDRHPQHFKPLARAMVRVGETGGILEQTSQQLTELMTRDQQIRTNLRNAAAYPLFVLAVGLASVVVVVTWILPRIVGTIMGDGVLLPAPTRMLLGLSDFVKGYWWLILILVPVLVFLFRRWRNTAGGRLRWDALKLRMPVLGGVLRTIAVGRFARTLGALTRSGVTILEALQVVRDTLDNERLAKEIDAAAEDVRVGRSLADSLAASGRFPPLLVQLVAVGEQTGKLDELLLDGADTFDSEADAAVTRFMAILPAVLILLLALAIGFVIAATLLPIVAMQLSATGI